MVMEDQKTLPGMARTGEDLMRDGVEQVWENEQEPWKDRVQKIILETAELYEFFDADDVKDRADRVGLEPPHHPNAWGAAFRVSQLAGVMEKTGNYVKSKRPNQHSTMIPRYFSLVVF